MYGCDQIFFNEIFDHIPLSDHDPVKAEITVSGFELE